MSAVIKKTSGEKYALLLGKYLPRVIETEAQYRRARKELRKFLLAGDNLAQEEVDFVKLLGLVIEDYEDRNYKIDVSEVTPLRKLKYLMGEHGHKAKDLWGVVADKGTISKILSGQRAISKAHAKRLAVLYHVTPAVFI